MKPDLTKRGWGIRLTKGGCFPWAEFIEEETEVEISRRVRLLNGEKEIYLSQEAVQQLCKMAKKLRWLDA